jgi:hypothetical protein
MIFIICFNPSGDTAIAQLISYRLNILPHDRQISLNEIMINLDAIALRIDVIDIFKS